MVCNAIPFLGIYRDFGVYGWLEFSFYRPVKIPFYAEGLKAVLDSEELKLGEGWLHFNREREVAVEVARLCADVQQSLSVLRRKKPSCFAEGLQFLF